MNEQESIISEGSDSDLEEQSGIKTLTRSSDQPKDQKQIYKKEKKGTTMAQILEETPPPPEEGDIIEGPVISIDNQAVYVDLAPFGTGVIYGRELMHARDIIRKINLGDTVSGKVIDPKNENGYTEISLKEARQVLIWEEAEEAAANKTPFELTVEEANKGGLILTWQGIQGFLPASQLNTEHYPNVEDGDKDRILEELRKLVGEKIKVYIITASPGEAKLIFSEKSETEGEEKDGILEKYSVGDVLEREITGIVDFGVFVKLEEGLEGLVHISELDWGLVENPRDLFSVGMKTKVKVIEKKDDRISLSIKALKSNPWEEAAKKYQKGQQVEGVIIKFNKHGALASIEEGVAGLVHVSEFGNEEKLRETLELGKTYPFVITYFDPGEQKMTLSYTNKDAEKEVASPDKKEVKTEEEKEDTGEEEEKA
ncbi:MAG: S1 RNA-binding domain-containing protein [Patescibacteria group bacterium]